MIEICNWEFHCTKVGRTHRYWADGVCAGSDRIVPGKISTGLIAAASGGLLQTSGGLEFRLLGFSRRGQSPSEIVLQHNEIYCDVLPGLQIKWCGKTFQIICPPETLTVGRKVKLSGRFSGIAFICDQATE